MKTQYAFIQIETPYETAPHRIVEFTDGQSFRNAIIGMANLLDRQIRVSYPSNPATQKPTNLQGHYFAPSLSFKKVAA